MSGPADSAGVPWRGRRFEANQRAADDGSAPPLLLEALSRFRAGAGSRAEVVEAVRESRLLIPLVAELGQSERDDAGRVIDKSQELSVVSVAGPDGRRVLPAFTSVQAMAAWNSAARPIPVDAVRVALAAADERTDLVVVDPRSVHEFVLRRPALWAIGRGLPWNPPEEDHDVLVAIRAATVTEPAVRAVELAAGDPWARLAGPELIVRLLLVAGLTRSALDDLLARLRARWAGEPVIAERVDSVGVKLGAAPVRQGDA